MQVQRKRLEDLQIPVPQTGEILGDLRFRALLRRQDWDALPAAVRRRFSKRVAHGATTVYVGEVVTARFTRTGWALAQAARLIGGPLPITRDTGIPAIVTVTEDCDTGGQIWTRLYARRHGFPQVIHSAKRFSGPTGLEEYVGCGVSMALIVTVEERCLSFRSTGYFLKLAGVRLRLPAWLTPGALTVTHADLGSDRFLFRLEILHPWLGRLIEQSAVFREEAP